MVNLLIIYKVAVLYELTSKQSVTLPVVLFVEHVGDAVGSGCLQFLRRLHLVRERTEQKQEVVRSARRRWLIEDTAQDIKMGMIQIQTGP